MGGVPAPGPNRLLDYHEMAALSADRIRHHVGTDRPTVAEYEAAQDAFDEEHELQWTGQYVLLYDGDQPTHVALWGSSGD